MGQVFLEGFLLQASLIFALGAQNLFVLESGLRRHHHLTVSFVCFLCDFTIIMLGVIGLASILNEYPQVKILVGILGVGFLAYYGISKIRTKEQDLFFHENLDRRTTLKKSVITAVTFSVINPHAYLDGIVLIGGYSTKFSQIEERLAVGLGAASYSLLWFLILSSASSKFLKFLTNPKRMKLALSFSGIVLVYLSFRLSFDVYGWVQESLETGGEMILQANH